ncbi:MAG: tRNA (pseudouridine(54)-N(1))-methyltransferase TrmY [Thermoplasmatales archaeon]|nr:tRNA (pseudouridine(54)-N(1))-methyltransferase TrmY [Thermoplasmatales archaeon]
MASFVVLGHRADASGDFKLDDICGGAGRLDILVRCVNSAFFLSHGIRKENEAHLLLLGGRDAPRVVTFVGSEIRYLNPDERSTASLIRNALLKDPGPTPTKSSPGVYAAGKSLDALLDELAGKHSFVLLAEDGVDVREADIPENPCFILGDNQDPTEEEIRAISGYPFTKVSVGPLSLHADHCITVLLNEMDRRAPR